MDIRSVALMAGLLLFVAMAACAPAPSPSATPNPTATSKPSAVPPLPTETPAQPTAVPTPTSAWETRVDAELGVTLQYPAGWQPQAGYERKYAGPDGFFQLSAIASAGLSIDEVAENDAHHKLQPYGSEPTIEALEIQGQEARLIEPSSDQPEAMQGQAGLIVHLPQPIEISGHKYDYLVLWADQHHIRQIAHTLKLETPSTRPTPSPSAVPSEASPVATRAARVGQHPCLSDVQVQQAGGLTKTVTVGYLLYLPEDYGADPRLRWPLILFLHGSEERGSNPEVLKKQGLPKILEQQPAFPFVVVSPQCPPEELWWPRTHILSALLDEVESVYAVDTKRIYVTGLSMGGYGAWALAYRYPKRFAAVAPIAGGYTDGTDSLPEDICVLKDVPIWAFHGALDRNVPASESERVVNALKECGSDVRFTLYPEVAHTESWELAYADPELYEWLLLQALE